MVSGHNWPPLNSVRDKIMFNAIHFNLVQFLPSFWLSSIYLAGSAVYNVFLEDSFILSQYYDKFVYNRISGF